MGEKAMFLYIADHPRTFFGSFHVNIYSKCISASYKFADDLAFSTFSTAPRVGGAGDL